jgi:hypothetical protein
MEYHTTKRSKLDKIGLCVYSAFVLFFAVYAFIKPNYNWDIIPYIGCALSYEDSDIGTLHSKTYEIVKRSVPPETYSDLTTSNAYRRNIATNPENFYQQLRFYHVKPFYVFLVYVFLKLGLPIIKATVLISVTSVIGIALILILWISEHAPGFPAALISLFLLIASGLPGLGRWLTPDALSSVVIFLSFFLLVEQKRLNLACLLLVLSLIIRTDNIILLIPLFTYMRITNSPEYRVSTKQYSIFMIMAILLYLTITTLTDSYSWWTLFSHTFLGAIQRPADYTAKFSLYYYINVVIRSIPYFYSEITSLFLLLASLTMVICNFRFRDRDIYLHITLVALLVICIRFLLYPAFPNRFFTVYYLVIGVMFVLVLGSKGCIRSTNSHPEAAT